MIFDSHAHYNDKAFDGDRSELLASMIPGGVGRIMNAAEDRATALECLALSREHTFIYGAVGIHPEDVDHETEVDWIEDLLKEPKIQAVGEIGLDYHWEDETHPRTLQQKVFRDQLALALETDTPVIIHSRDAAADTLSIMKDMGGDRLQAVIHCFSYSEEMAEEFLKLGYYIGIGGVVTFKNSKKLKRVARMVPSDRLLLETDCPYMAPTPHRGERNSSLYLHEVVAELASLRETDAACIEEITWENANRLYRI